MHFYICITFRKQQIPTLISLCNLIWVDYFCVLYGFIFRLCKLFIKLTINFLMYLKYILYDSHFIQSPVVL